MDNFLFDKTFLAKVNRSPVTEYLAAITLLDFSSEKPIARLEGKVISGSMSISSTSATRRTGSLSILFDDTTADLTNPTNLISINKKVRISIGRNNPYYGVGYEQYDKYGKELWFKQGVFIITGASSSISTTGRTISMNFIDKMGMLNGTCGGTLPASVSFHELLTIDKDENVTVEYPEIKRIIYEAVQHFGGEHAANILIEDVPDTGRQIVRYIGTDPLYIQKQQTESGTTVIGRNIQIGKSFGTGQDDQYEKNNIIGYMETPLTYPGELVQKPGSTVTAVLDEIVKTLGNYEYFYDVDGIFHFRQKRNFVTTGVTPIGSSIEVEQGKYAPRFSDYQYLNEYSDAALVTQVSFNPKYENIKNDFICWGTKNDKNGTNASVRYHLAIDEKPKDRTDALCHSAIYVKKDEDGTIIGYTTKSSEGTERVCEPVDFNWREELYRKALLAYGTSTRGSEYDEELLAEWRNIFDPSNTAWQTEWESNFGEAWKGYNPAVVLSPNKLKYWLDIIDSSADIGKYSIKSIGKRTKVIENSKIDEIFSPIVPDIVFVRNPRNNYELRNAVHHYITIGQQFCIINDSIYDTFTFVNSYGSCYEEIQSMLYNDLIYNASVNLTSLPIFYLDVNSVIRLNFKELKIYGDYILNSINYNLGTSGGTMSLQLNESVTIN